MPEIPTSAVKVARVLHQDDEFMTVEIAKTNDASFTLDPESTDTFYFLSFLNLKDGKLVNSLAPWER